MGRPERQLSGHQGPVQAFAAELRALREEAGRPKYAVLSQRTGRSQTALSEAAGGRRFPTWETVAAFVEGCCGDPAYWRPRWQAVCDLLQSAPEPVALITAEPAPPPALSTGPTLPPPLPPAPPPPPIPNTSMIMHPITSVPVPPVARHASGSRRESVWWWALVAGTAIGATLMLAALSAVKILPMTTTTMRAAAAGAATVADEADPKDAGCAEDSGVQTLDSVEVDYAQTPIGTVQLRYSPRCGAAWPRFVPYTASAVPAGAWVTVTVIRPRDNRRAEFGAKYGGIAIYGNLLRSTVRCVRAETAIAMGPGDTTTAHTGCFRGRVHEEDMPGLRPSSTAPGNG